MPKVKKGKNAGKKEKEKKNAEPKEKKVRIDKTFGMKNRKGSSNKRYLSHMKNNETQGNRSRVNKKKLREMEKFAEAKMMGTFVGRVGGVKKGMENAAAQRAANAEAKDGDKKVKVCAFFAKGLCRRGNKCKFSHDLALLQKATKEDNLINVYEDKRDKRMEDMTREELDKVIQSKERKSENHTDIICKYFLEALEKQHYGHRWHCPNGDECIYRHKLPYGYVLQAKRENEDGAEESLEEGLERMRREVLFRDNLTPVTPESFAEWKKTWIKREDDEKAKAAKKAAKSRGGNRQLSGKQLFTFDPTLFQTSDDTVDLTAQLDAQRHKTDGLDELPKSDLETILEKDEEEEVQPATNSTAPAANAEVFDASLFEDEILPDEVEKTKKKKKKKKDKDGGGDSTKKRKKNKKNKGDPTTSDLTGEDSAENPGLSQSVSPRAFPGYSPEKLKPVVTETVIIGDAKLFTDSGDLPDF